MLAGLVVSIVIGVVAVRLGGRREGTTEIGRAEDAGPPSSLDAESFAADMLAAAKAAHPEASIRYAADRYVLVWEVDGGMRGELALGKAHREAASLRAAERRAFVAKRVASIGAEPLLPSTFAEAEAHLVPIVRPRISWELARLVVAEDPLSALPPEPPHVAIGDGLWGGLAFETDEQLLRIDAARLARWNVTFDKAWAGAMDRLAKRSSAPSFRRDHGLVAIGFGDANASARVLLPSALLEAKLAGDLAVAIPRDDELLVASASDDEALGRLADRLESGDDDDEPRVVRIGANGQTTDFELPPAHPLHARFRGLRRSAEDRDDRRQRDALRDKLGDHEDVPFVATRMHAKNPTTGDEVILAIHSEDVTTLLPRADWVVFQRVDMATRTSTVLACGTWDRVSALQKERWKAIPLWPPRWLAVDHPSARELAELGCDHPMLKAMGRPGGGRRP